MRKVLMFMLVVSLLLALVMAMPISAQAATATPTPFPTLAPAVVVTEQANAPVVVEPSSPVVVEQPSDTTSIPSWILVNGAVLLFALGVIWDLGKSALQNRSLKNTLATITGQQEGAIKAALSAMPPEAQALYKEIVAFLANVNGGATALLKVAGDVEPEDTAPVSSVSTPSPVVAPAGTVNTSASSPDVVISTTASVPMPSSPSDAAG